MHRFTAMARSGFCVSAEAVLATALAAKSAEYWILTIPGD